MIGDLLDNSLGPQSGSAYVYQQMTSICLYLSVENLVADQKATFIITGGTPGRKAVTVYGTKADQTVINNISNYCATFGINGITRNDVLGGLNLLFDANGKIIFKQSIPANSGGTQVFFQSAMQGTCPDECISNLVEMTVQ